MRWFAYLSAFVVAFVSFYSFGAIKRDVFHFTWTDGEHGSRWAKVQCLRDDIIHVETFETRGFQHEKKGPSKTDATWISPMIDRDFFYHRFKGASKCDITGTNADARVRVVETADIKMVLRQDLRCFEVFDKKRNTRLSNICTEKLDKDEKTVFIEKLEMKNVYGVGNLFLNGKDADGDWEGKHWDARVRGHGNFRFGQKLGDQFYQGGPSISQFPMIYVLGDGYKNYGLLLDQVWKVGWDFRGANFEGKQGAPFGWSSYMWGDQVRFFVMTGPDLKDLKRDYHDLTGYPQVPAKNVFGHWTSEFGYNNWTEVHYDVASLYHSDFPIEGVALDLQWFGGSFGDPSSHRMGTLQFYEGIAPSKNGGEFKDPKWNIKHLYDKYGIVVMPIEESYVDPDSGLADFNAMSNPNRRKEFPVFNRFPEDKACYLARFNEFAKPGDVPWDAAWVRKPFWLKAEKGYQNWFGGGSMVDWSNPNARLVWHDVKRQPNAEMGIFNFWLDLGEPEMYYEGSFYHGLPVLGKHDHGSVHNIYNLSWAKGITEGFERNKDKLRKALNELRGADFQFPPRHFSLSRSGTIGSHRYGGMWSGDVFSNFENLRAHANSQMHMSLLGQDYYSSDTGGFFHGDRVHKPGDPFDREVFTQWAAYTSLVEAPMRPHAWALDENWFQPDNNKTWTDVDGKKRRGVGTWNQRYTLNARGHLDSNRANVRRRYELIPYVYSLAHRAHLTGEPVYPPVVYHYQDETDFREEGDIKMIGNSLLFGMAAGFKETRRKVRLPKGWWIDYENHKWYKGGKRVGPIGHYRKERVPESELKEDPERAYFMLPLFAKAGAIIPKAYVDDKTRNVFGLRKDNSVRNELIVRAYVASIETFFTLFEDDGLTTAYKEVDKNTGRRKFVRKTVLSQHHQGDRARVTIEAAQDDHQYSIKNRKNQVELVTNDQVARSVTLNGQDCVRAKTVQAIQKAEANDAYCWYHPGANNLIWAQSKGLSVYEKKEFKFELQNPS